MLLLLLSYLAANVLVAVLLVQSIGQSDASTKQKLIRVIASLLLLSTQIAVTIQLLYTQWTFNYL